MQDQLSSTKPSALFRLITRRRRVLLRPWWPTLSSTSRDGLASWGGSGAETFRQCGVSESGSGSAQVRLCGRGVGVGGLGSAKTGGCLCIRTAARAAPHVHTHPPPQHLEPLCSSARHDWIPTRMGRASRHAYEVDGQTPIRLGCLRIRIRCTALQIGQLCPPLLHSPVWTSRPDRIPPLAAPHRRAYPLHPLEPSKSASRHAEPR